MVEQTLPLFVYDEVEVGEELGSYEYVLTQEMIDLYRRAVDDPGAVFPTIAVKHDATSLSLAYDDQTGSVNAGNEIELYNPPIPGKKILVTGRIHDKYIRRDNPYLVIEATATDEDGRLIEKMRTYQLKKPEELGKKWHPQG
jgi:hypothetical protein